MTVPGPCNMIYSRWVLTLLSAALVAGGISACFDTKGPCICTTEFRSIGLTVVDQTGTAVPDVTLTRTNLRSGARLAPSLASQPPGLYVVADDGMKDAFSSEGDSVQVVGEKAGATVTTYFVIAVPAPCRCHVTKLSGPDTVTIVVQPSP